MEPTPVVVPVPAAPKAAYDFKAFAEIIFWPIVLSLLAAIGNYLVTISTGEPLDPRVIGPALLLICGRAVVGGLRAGIPKVLDSMSGKTNTIDPAILEQLAVYMDKRLDERFGPGEPPPVVVPLVVKESTTGTRVDYPPATP